jgi:SAM-dependent methyltransferase
MPAEPVDPAEYWNVSAEAWVRHADEIEAHARPYGEAGITALAPQAGEHLLDLGCGCGETTLELGRRVTTAGSVVGVDVSDAMLELARRRAEAAERRHVTFAHADVATADLAGLAGGPVDGAYSRFGVMFFLDPVAAFANIAAGMRPGGRLALVVWQGPEVNPWAVLPGEVAAEPLGTTWAAPVPGQPGPYGLAAEDEVRRVLGGAGFVDVELEGFTSAAVLRVDDLDAETARLISIGPMRTPWEAAGDDARRAAVAAVQEAMAPYRDGSCFRLPGAIWVVTARRPDSQRVMGRPPSSG